MESDSKVGLRLLSTATAGMVLILALLAGGVALMGPDLEDGAPPPPIPASANVSGPIAVTAGPGIRAPRPPVADVEKQPSRSDKDATDQAPKSEQQPPGDKDQ